MNQALTLLDHLNTFTPYAVGFDRLFDQLASSSRVTSSYPPYNIIRENDYDFKIEMALAGFSKEDIEVLKKMGRPIVEVKEMKNEESVVCSLTGSPSDFNMDY